MTDSLSKRNAWFQRTIMRIQIIDNVEQIESIADEWRALLAESASPTPFQTPEYVLAWWKHLGGGEWNNGELQVITARGQEDELIGIAPLFAHADANDQTTLMFIGSHEISDFLDFVARPANLSNFIQTVFKHLSSSDLPAWHVIDLYNVLEESETIQLIEENSSKFGWECETEKLQAAPLLTLPATWEEYLSSMKKKQRHELRRKLRKAENHIVPVTWQIIDEDDLLEDEVAAMFEMMKQDLGKQEFLTGAMQKQICAIAHAALRNNWLQLVVLTVGNERAAVHLNFDYDNRIWGYNSGVDSRFRELSTGVVLLGNALQHSIETGREVFDFMRGDEQYKYRFGAQDRFIYRLKITK